MHKKSFTFGIGVGILSMTLVFFFVYSIVRDKWEQERAVLQADLATAESVTPIIGLTEAEALAYAEAMGMTYPTVQAPAPTAEPTVSEPTTEPAATEEPIATPEPTQAPIPTLFPSINASEAEGMITFTIPEGLNAQQVCELLADAGVVDNTDGFVAYLQENGLTTRLAHGTYTVPVGCGYDELMTYWKYR